MKLFIVIPIYASFNSFFQWQDIRRSAVKICSRAIRIADIKCNHIRPRLSQQQLFVRSLRKADILAYEMNVSKVNLFLCLTKYHVFLTSALH
jgi:hypothetical protein